MKKFLLDFCYKITSRAFWVWLISTGIVFYALRIILGRESPPEYSWTGLLLGIWGGTALLFVGGNVLIDAFSKMIEKANLTINQSNSVSLGGKNGK